jgi:hypothetical protein
MAVYLMGGFRQSAQQPDVICFGLRRPGAAQGSIEPLPNLFATAWRDYNEQLAPNLVFTAWGLVDYLLHGHERAWRPDFRSLMTALGQKQDGYDALRAAYPADLINRIDDDVRAHIRHVEGPNLCPLPYRMTSVRRPRVAATVSPVPEATMQAFFAAMEALPARDGYADFFR